MPDRYPIISTIYSREREEEIWQAMVPPCKSCKAIVADVQWVESASKHLCPKCRAVHHDVHLSSGRTIRHTREPNGSQLATPTTGSYAMTPTEAAEYDAARFAARANEMILAVRRESETINLFP